MCTHVCVCVHACVRACARVLLYVCMYICTRMYSQIENDVGQCRPLFAIYTDAYDVACLEAVDGLVKLIQTCAQL